ncbi:MAG: hypothetical protein KDN05_13520, partial [Verrucomicrobiae bacterium]|nr:hypothetical protein [Verrucomicrobiae bacterium]
MKFILLMAVALIATDNGRCAGTERLEGATYEERALAMLRSVASIRPAAKDENYPKAAAPYYAARLALGADLPYALEKLNMAASYRVAMAKDRLARHAAYAAAKDKSTVRRPGPALDPFDKAALVHTYFIGKKHIPKNTALKIRDYVALWDDHKQLAGYARGAWNYKLMMDASGYLAAEEWPELVDRAGLTAPQIKEATRKRLFDGFHDIATRNFSEYGAPIYLGVNLCAVRMLADFARDPEMRNRASMTLDAMLLDIACTWNQGYNTGSASRAKYWYSTDTGRESMASTAACAWLFFGAPESIRARGIGEAHSIWMAAPGRYRCPEPIVWVANQRSSPFLHTSFVAAMGSSNVHRRTWHTPGYSLCSQWDEPGEPTSGLYKESRRHMLKWVSDKPSSTFVVCMENPAKPYSPKERRANALGYGENAYSRYMQHEGTLLGFYAVPEKMKVRNREFDYPFYKMYVPFPATGSIVRRIERDGWIFCHNGSMLMAFHSAKPCKWGKRWGNHDMLWCDARRNAWILETSPLEPFAGGGVNAELDRFAEAVVRRVALDVSLLEQDPPAISYKNLAGDRMDFRWQA